MKNKHFLLLATALISSSVFAASPLIRSDREAECAIYLCLPGGFTQGCEAAKSAYIGRITDLTSGGKRRYTDLPAFNLCEDQNPPGIEDFPLTEKSEVSYRGRYEISRPAYNTCTRWNTIHYGGSSYTRCAAIKTTPAKKFESDYPRHEYKTIQVGQKDYSTNVAPYRHYTEVLVDGKPVGERYYD